MLLVAKSQNHDLENRQILVDPVPRYFRCRRSLIGFPDDVKPYGVIRALAPSPLIVIAAEKKLSHRFHF